MQWSLSGKTIIAFKVEVFFIKWTIVSLGTTEDQTLPWVNKTMDGDGTFFAQGNGIDSKFGTCQGITSGEYIRLSGLERNRIRLDCPIGIQFYPAVCNQIAPIHGLAY